MNYKEVVEASRASGTMKKIAAFVGQSQERFDGLANDFFSTEGQVQNRLIWAISHTLDQAPQLAGPHYEAFCNILGPENSTWLKRGITRMMAKVPLPKDEDVLGLTYSKCFDLASDPKHEVAARSFSIFACTRIAMAIPELKEELVPMIEDVFRTSEKGLKSAAKSSLKKLRSGK